jgi:DNA-binding MarR family transcriptional regulator
VADDDDYYNVWLGILERSSRPRFVDLILNRAGVTLGADFCRYLVHIDLRGPIGVLELAELVEHNHPKVSRTLARLADLGLVERAHAPQDRRIKTASVTPEGRKIVEAINEGRRRILREAFAGWSDHDRTELARLTGRFADAIQTLIDEEDAKEAAKPPEIAD